MEVNEIELYHIHKNCKWEAKWVEGNEIIFDKSTKNEFNDYYENNSIGFNILGENCAPIFAGTKMLSAINMMNLQDFTNYINYSISIFKECGMYIRESIFEEVRKKSYPDYPSRLNCIWLCELNKVKYWYSVLGNIGKIVKVNVSGQMIKCDQVYLYNEIKPHSDIRTDAEKYWSGKSEGILLNEEVLFEGKVKIIKVYNSINEFEVARS